MKDKKKKVPTFCIKLDLQQGSPDKITQSCQLSNNVLLQSPENRQDHSPKLIRNIRQAISPLSSARIAGTDNSPISTGTIMYATQKVVREDTKSCNDPSACPDFQRLVAKKIEDTVQT
jgi:hypothetical protein